MEPVWPDHYREYVAHRRGAVGQDWCVSRRRKPQKRPNRSRTSAPSPAAFATPTAQAHGQPVQSARPYVTSNMSYMVEPIFSEHSPHPVPGTPGPSGSPGLYRLTYVLAVPGRNVVQDEVNFEKQVRDGDSLLEVSPETHYLELIIGIDPTQMDTTMRVNVNDSHRLRDVELEIRADNFAHAQNVGHDLVAPVLSRWAFLHDVAITSSVVQIEELTTQIRQWIVPFVGAVKGFSDIEGVSTEDHRVLLSAYREGISSTEPLWQALSLFRVAEGVSQMRQVRSDAALARGEVPSEPSERVPNDVAAIGAANDYNLQDSLRPYSGRKFSAVLDSIRPVLRNAIAHLNPDEDVLVQDRWSDLRKVESSLPALRWIARQLLDAELQAH